MPSPVIRPIDQISPDNAFDLHFCITSLFLLLCVSPFNSLRLYQAATFSKLLMSLLCSSPPLINWVFFPIFFSFFSRRLCLVLLSLSLIRYSYVVCVTVRPPQTRSGNTCRRWGFFTLASLLMSSAMARWYCRTSGRAPLPPKAPCSLAPSTAWLVGSQAISHSDKHC